MNRIFHILANEGKAITILRKQKAKAGIYITAQRAEIIIRLEKLKKYFLQQK